MSNSSHDARAESQGEGPPSREDYAFFEKIWKRTGAALNAPRAGRKKRKVADAPGVDGVDRGGEDKSSNDSAMRLGGGPIENMDFVMTQKVDDGDERRTSKESREQLKRKRHHDINQLPPGCYDIPTINDLLGWATNRCSSETMRSSKNDTLSALERGFGLSHIPIAPPPPSHIEHLHDCIRKRLDDNINSDIDLQSKTGGDSAMNERAIHSNLLNANSSAYVAIGMAVEEVLTLALMPLANAHVSHCRRLERLREKEKSRWGGNEINHAGETMKTVDPFHAWTLPPAEAIVELATKGGER